MPLDPGDLPNSILHGAPSTSDPDAYVPWFSHARAVVQIDRTRLAFFESAPTAARAPKRFRCCWAWSKDPRGWALRPKPTCKPGDHDHAGIGAWVLRIHPTRPWMSRFDGHQRFKIAMEADGAVARMLRDSPDRSVFVVEGTELLKTTCGITRVLRIINLNRTTLHTVRGQLAATWINRKRSRALAKAIAKE